MRTGFAERFDKDANKINDAKILDKIEEAIFNVKEARTMRDISNLKKLKGYKIHYRIKIGKFRIGVTIEGDLVIFVRCLHRKDFYRHFP